MMEIKKADSDFWNYLDSNLRVAFSTGDFTRKNGVLMGVQHDLANKGGVATAWRNNSVGWSLIPGWLWFLGLHPTEVWGHLPPQHVEVLGTTKCCHYGTFFKWCPARSKMVPLDRLTYGALSPRHFNTQTTKKKHWICQQQLGNPNHIDMKNQLWHNCH